MRIVLPCFRRKARLQKYPLSRMGGTRSSLASRASCMLSPANFISIRSTSAHLRSSRPHYSFCLLYLSVASLRALGFTLHRGILPRASSLLTGQPRVAVSPQPKRRPIRIGYNRPVSATSHWPEASSLTPFCPRRRQLQ